MPRKRHSKKDIEEALVYAESHGWRIEPATGHAWGRLYCPYNSADCRCGEYCVISIWSTPRSASNHARQIRRVIDRCLMRANDEDHEQ